MKFRYTSHTYKTKKMQRPNKMISIFYEIMGYIGVYILPQLFFLLCTFVT